MSERPELVELDIDTDREAFVRRKAPELLRNLDPGAEAVWGSMTPQHMVEHLTYITENSLGRRKFPLLIPEEKLPKYKAFLMSNRGFMRNFKFPLLPDEGLPALKHENYESAMEEFVAVNKEFLDMVNDPSFETAPHPFYGQMVREEAIMFQFKHFTHHLMQFGLL